MKQKVNITLELDEYEVSKFEYWLRNNVNVLDFLVVPDTSELYKSDPVFKKLSKAVKDAKLGRDRYYNEKR
jgi:hypothetical protein